MSQKSNTLTNQGSLNQITDEYRVLHKVAQVLESSGSLMDVLQKAMQIITEFKGLHVENKAGIFLADNEKKVLRLLTTFGAFSHGKLLKIFLFVFKIISNSEYEFDILLCLTKNSHFSN